MSGLNIIEVLIKELNLDMRGRGRFSIKCPFHIETAPSLRIYPDSDDGDGSYYCFGCGAAGNAINFVRRLRNLKGAELRDYLREEYGFILESDRDDHDYTSQLSEKLQILTNTNFLKSNKRVYLVALAILRYLEGDEALLNRCTKEALNDNESV